MGASTQGYGSGGSSIMNKGTIWIDLTDLSIWTGHYTGIQRLVYNLASRYSAQDNVRYVSFDEPSHTFIEVDFSVLTTTPATAGSPSAPRFRQRLKGRAIHSSKQMLHRSPQIIRQRFTPEVKHKLRKGYQQSRHLAVQLLGRSPKQVRVSGTPAIFKPNDTVLIMGAAWDRPALIEQLTLQKRSIGFKLYQVIYDLIPSLFPHLFGAALFEPYTQYLFEAASISDGLVAISESTKHDLKAFCKRLLIPVPPIGVIRLGDEFEQSEHPASPHADLESRNYILAVGTIEVRKNHALLYNVWKLAAERKITLPKLVIVGGPGWYTGDITYEFQRDPALKGLVYIMNRVDDNQLAWLYQNCLVSVYPSVYEGWGLPVAESLAYGKLALSSRASSMPEIAGDLIDYFSPYDTAECLAVITKYLEPDLLQQKEHEIAAKYGEHTWDTTFDQFDQFIKTH
jgi:glycosyltransferase involved in cell wall biosynthesis